MEEKESTVSVSSPGDSDIDSPPPVSSVVVPLPLPQVINNINMNMEADIISTQPSGGGGSGSAVISVDLLGKKKRGRPGKYDSEGNLRVQPSHKQQLVAEGWGGALTSPQQPSGFSFSPSSPPPPPLSDGSKRGRGRPPGSGNWQILASLGELFANTAGGDFTPHVVTVSTGEDVAGKILSLAQKGPRGICVLSANGTVSNVTIRQPGSSGGIFTYEGRFEILSLSGSFTVAENGGVKSRTGGLSVSLASPDGRVIGGGIAGCLLAANPIQIVVGSFMPNGYKIHKKKHHRENTMGSVISGPPDKVTEARPISQAKPVSGTALISTSPSPFPEQNHGGINNNASDHQLQNPTNSYKIPVCWIGLEPTSDQRPSPDINVSIPSEDDVQGLL